MKHASEIIFNPRITEKAAFLSESGAYAFVVAPQASKREVAQAIREIYKVSPRKVTLVRIPRKARTSRTTNRVGHSAGGKKAYVFLKKGDKIELA